MKLPRFFRRLIGAGKPGKPGAAGLGHAVAWIFIILVALFLTEQHHLFDGPVPLPAELGLEPAYPG